MELVVKRFGELTVEELYEILRLRVDIFVLEQRCLYPEIDGRDPTAWHVFFREKGAIKAYLRVLPPGVSFPEAALGRVLAAERRRGLGSRIVAEGIRIAREKLGTEVLMLEAQTYARGLYERAGFRQVSEEFLEDGIPHILMRRDGREQEERI